MSRVLIIEDELPMRTALQDCLASEGYRVLGAADGERGLAHALQDKPDLILLDIMMPRLDGYSVCAELRRRGNAVPILMLTAKGQVEDRVKGLDAGADESRCISRPRNSPCSGCWPGRRASRSRASAFSISSGVTRLSRRPAPSI